MTYASVCSGIEATSVAWGPLGWQAHLFSEVDPFACALLAQRYPTVPNFGDLLQHEEWPDGAIDVVVGGPPCQSFSVAGDRGGLADGRGHLTLAYLALVARRRPRWVVFENVPGLLSSNDGRDFSTVLGRLAECGYGFAYRMLDAQYFGLAQRRRRVFVVGHLGDWRRAAAVLFERASLSGHPAPRRDPRQTTARGSRGSAARCSLDLTAGTLGAEMGRNRGIGNENELSMLCASSGDLAYGLNAGATQRIDIESETILAFAPQAGGKNSVGECYLHDLAPTLPVTQQLAVHDGHLEGAHHQVRRLTPRECERLQGFPDDYTLIRYRGRLAKDAPRYKALGNAIAVPVLRWIGERIARVEALTWRH